MPGTVIADSPQQAGADRFQGGRIIRSRRRLLKVQTSLVGDGVNVVRDTPGVPRMLEGYAFRNEIDLGLRVSEVSPRQISKYLWEVDVGYSNDFGESPENERNENPLLRPPDVSLTFEPGKRIHGGRLKAGKPDDIVPAGAVFEVPLKNSAGEVFDPPPELDSDTPILRIERNEATFFPVVAILYENAVNSDPYFGAGAGQCKIRITSATRVREEALTYARVVYEIKYRREGWDLELLDIGSYYLDGGDKKPFTDEAGHPILGLLDGAGAEAAADTYHWLTFPDLYKKQPYAPLALPETFL